MVTRMQSKEIILLRDAIKKYPKNYIGFVITGENLKSKFYDDFYGYVEYICDTYAEKKEGGHRTQDGESICFVEGSAVDEINIGGITIE